MMTAAELGRAGWGWGGLQQDPRVPLMCPCSCLGVGGHMGCAKEEFQGKADCNMNISGLRSAWWFMFLT